MPTSSGTVEVRQVDPSDDAALRAVWEAAYAAHGLRPHNTYWPWETFAALQRAARTDLETVLLEARLEGRVVGMVEMQLYLTDNDHLVGADLHTHPGHRRRGVGSALLAEMERRIREAGRTTLLVDVFVRPGEQQPPGVAFGTAHGFEVAMEEGFKACDLDETESRWDELEHASAQHHDAYRLVTWQRAVPADLIAAYCQLQSNFLGETPLGEMDLKAETWDATRVQERDARLAASGRHQIGTVALGPDGSPAGLSELSFTTAAPDTASQGVTMVLPGHRGRRLGMGLKVATLRALREAEPRCRYVFTDNADVNVHMNAVNEQLGFTAVERMLTLQKTYPAA
jgi:GNAT superfamily N-acetyltransferase